MTFRVPGVLDERTMPDAALRAAVLDGELYRIGEAYRSIDLPVDAAARAASLERATGGGAILAGRTAAWVWGVIPGLPEPRERIMPPHRGIGHSPAPVLPGWRTRTVRLGAAEVALVGGVAVTTARRTAIDLACADSSEDAWLAGLVALAGLSIEQLIDDLAARRRLRGRDAAIARVQLLVTR